MAPSAWLCAVVCYVVLCRAVLCSCTHASTGPAAGNMYSDVAQDCVRLAVSVCCKCCPHCCADPTLPHPWYTSWHQSSGASLLPATCSLSLSLWTAKDLQSVVTQRSRGCCYPSTQYCQSARLAEMGAVGQYKRSVCGRCGADHRHWWWRTVLSVRDRESRVRVHVGCAPFQSNSCVRACV